MNLSEILSKLPMGKKKLGKANFKLYDNVKFTTSIEKELLAIDEDLVLNIGPSASINSFVVNDVDDLKQDAMSGFYLEKSEASTLLASQAIMMHKIKAELNTTGSYPINDILKFGSGMQMGIDLKWFRPYDKELTVAEVLSKDLKHYKTLLTDANDDEFWEIMVQNEAFSFAYDGELDFSVSVNLAELLGMSLSPVFALTAAENVLPFVIDPSLSVTFNVAKTDEFECLVYKISEEKYGLRLTTKKGKARGVSLNSGINLSLLDTDKEKVIDLIDSYFEDYLGSPTSEIDAALKVYDKYVKDDFILYLADRIHFNGAEDIIALKNCYQKYKKQINTAKAKVLKYFKKGVDLGLTYKYKKVLEKGLFLDAEVAIDVLRPQLKNILALDVRDIVELARKRKGVEIKTYFTESLKRFEKDFAIGITLGNWALKSSSEEVIVFDKKQYEEEGVHSLSVSYLYKKAISTGKERMTYQVSMQSEKEKSDHDICYDELENCLTLTATKSDNRVKRNDKKDMDRMFTTSVAWGGVNEEGLMVKSKEVWEKIYGDEEVKYECKLSIPDSCFKDTLFVLSQYITLEVVANAMSVAMLPTPGIEESWSVEKRLEFYSPLILNAFKGMDKSELLNSTFYQTNFKEWSDIELNNGIVDQNMVNHYIGGHDMLSGKSIAKDLVSAVNLLAYNIQSGEQLEDNQSKKKKTVIKFFYRQLKSISKDYTGFSQRWFGQLLVASCQAHQPELLNEMVKTLTVNFKDEEKSKVMIIGN